MNAIDQYIAPPPRPDTQQAASSSARSSSDGNAGPSFGDVYNRSANNNRNDQQGAQDADQRNQTDTDTGAEVVSAASNKPVSNKAVSDKASSGSQVSNAIFKLAGATAASATPGTTTTTTAKDKAATAETADDLAQAAADAADALAKAALAAKGDKKDATKAAEAKADAQQAAPQAADNAAELLKLLNASTGAEVKGKKTVADADVKEAGADKEKQVDVKDNGKVDTATTTADSVLPVTGMAVEAVGNRPSNQDDQSGKKSGDQDSKAAGALKAVGSDATQTTDKVPGTETDKPSKTETVTVLEARRFVGSGESLSANTQALVSGMKGDSDWAAAMKAASAANATVSEQRTATPVNTLKIQMTPENLGNVTATLRLHGDQLTVHLSVESADAFKQLSHDKDGLVQSLKSQGFTVDQVSVQMTPASADKSVAQSSSGQQTGGQQQGGQQMQDGSAGQFAQQRGQENNRRQQDNGFTTNWQADDRRTTVDTGSVAPDSTRSGQVYL